MESSGVKLEVDEPFKEKLYGLRVVELQAILRLLSVPIQGVKTALQERILDYFNRAVSKYRLGELQRDDLVNYFKIAYKLFDQRFKSSSSPTVTTPPANISSSQPMNGHSSSSTVTSTSSKAIQSNGTRDSELSKYASAFDENPFYQTAKTLTTVKLKISGKSGKQSLATFDVPFNFKDGHVIQVFCFEESKSEAIHAWPTAFFELRINNKLVNTAKGKESNLKKHKENDKVSDITVLCHTGPNTLSITFNNYTAYLLVINLMKIWNVNSLADKVLTKKPTEYEKIEAAIQQSFHKNQDGLQEVASKLPLLCPLTRSTIQIPTRSTQCKHFQCFELKSYLMMNERVPRWKCPVCNKSAPYNSLIVDTFMQKILSSVPKDVNEIELQPDASWVIPGQKKRKTEQVSPSTVSTVLIESDNEKESAQDFHSNAFVTILADTTPDLNSTCKSCFICGITEKTKRCSKCKNVSYCGRDCQTMDWPRHKQECQRLADALVSSNGHSTTGNGQANNLPPIKRKLNNDFVQTISSPSSLSPATPSSSVSTVHTSSNSTSSSSSPNLISTFAAPPILRKLGTSAENAIVLD